jgi:hypothetical protein
MKSPLEGVGPEAVTVTLEGSGDNDDAVDGSPHFSALRDQFRLGFVGTTIAWQTLVCVVWRAPYLFGAVRRGPTAIDGRHPQSGHGLEARY